MVVKDEKTREKHLLNAHAQPIFALRAFYDHLLTVREKKDSFHPFLQVF